MKYSLPVLFQKIRRRLGRYQQRLVLLRRRLLRRPAVFDDGYTLVDNTLVVLYASDEHSYGGYQPRVRLHEAALRWRGVKVSLIATVRNEARNISEWGESLRKQTRLPDEVVITDAGSTDDTVELLKQLAAQLPVPLHILSEPGANIARGRNIAVEQAQYPVIATTDFGCRLHADWLEKLIAPFEIEPQTQVVAGMYRVVNPSQSFGISNPWWSNEELVDPASFLPSGRSCAFTKSAWRMVGGYPEWLSLTGEDTYFDMELKQVCPRWAFSPEARVDWEAPGSFREYWKKLYRWSIGDGETGMKGTAYWWATIVTTLTLAGLAVGLIGTLLGVLLRSPLLLAAGAVGWLSVIYRVARLAVRAKYSIQEVLLVIGIMAAQAYGFLQGARRRLQVTRRRFQTVKGITFMLAVIPIDDTGGGARSTQIALELLRRGQLVCFVNMYPKAESVDLNLVIRHPNLVTVSAADFSLAQFCDRYALDLARNSVMAVVEMPHPQWLPMIEALRAQGASVVYEVIDEWDSDLGAAWYSPEVEQRTVQSAAVLTATAPLLQERLQKQTGRAVCLLPNAVNLRLFNWQKTYPPPADLPGARPRITYIGALYGSWFDWDVLVSVARAFPQASVVVIGDYRGQCPVALPNLHFLGLKPQTSLPAYLAHTDVAIIPWKINEITQATSPLKLYEYLAMHVPVVVPDLLPLRDIPALYRSTDTAGFLRGIADALSAEYDHAQVETFVAQNSWQARVDQLLDLVPVGK